MSKTYIFEEAYVAFVDYQGRSPLRTLFYSDSILAFVLWTDELLKVLLTMNLSQGSLSGLAGHPITTISQIPLEPYLESHPLAVRAVHGRCRAFIGRRKIDRLVILSVIFRLFYHGHNSSAVNKLFQMSLKLWQFHFSFLISQGRVNDTLRPQNHWSSLRTASVL